MSVTTLLTGTEVSVSGICKMIDRAVFISSISDNFRIHSVGALLGPRQCGKTTLAKLYSSHFDRKVYHFDLEAPAHLARLENPKLALDPLEGLIIIDEIQLRLDLFPYLRVLSDNRTDCRYLILGSASRDLIKQSSETLAGRIGYIELTPFQLRECGECKLDQLWARGGFPKSYLAETEADSLNWRKSYIQTFLGRGN